jgi:signal transduction histidine kinase
LSPGLNVVVQDNGKGFDVSIPHNGNGITNIHARAKEIDAVMQINSGANGTVIEVVCDV